MSTLSELFPSGGTQNNIQFVAQGTLANGQTVALRSDGKVEAVSQTSVSGSMGTAVQFEAGGTRDLAAAYSAEDNKYLVIYTDQGDSNKLKAVVGTPSGTNTIAFGTPVAVSANSNQYQSSKGCSYDATAKKIVVSFSDAGNSNYLTTLVATISGTSVSFGAATILNSAMSSYVHSFYHAGAGKTCVVSSLTSSGLLRTCTVGSTAITSSTAANFDSSRVDYSAGCYDSKNELGVIYFNKAPSTAYPTVRAFTLSGETATFGTEDTLVSTASYIGSLAYDAKNDYVCVIINYQTNTQNSIGVRFNSNGSVNSKTSVTQVAAANSYNSTSNGIVYDAGGEAVYVCFSSASSAVMNIMSFGSNAYTIGSSITVTSSSSYTPGLAQSSANFNIGVFYRDGNNSNYGYGSDYVVARLASNASSFIGITNAAISSGATGEVAVKGGLSTGGNLLPFAPTAGSPVTYESGFAVTKSVSYDTNANKAVIANRRGSDDYGIVYVGTVSGTSISFGSVAVFNAGTTEYISSAFDSNANKVVIAYTDSSNSGYGTAIVGTVSGTSITFGTEAVFEAAAVNGKSIVFDSTSNKVVIFYEDDANNDYGTAVVGTVSGTSISFGTPVVFDSVNMQITEGEGAAYDSANNRAVVFYRNSNYQGYAAVGTVSGTSISFGTPVKFSSGANELDYISAAFDSAANKIVTSYTDNTDSGYSKAIVGTVSGTSISFGSEATFESASSGFTSATFNSTINKVVISYTDFANSNYGTLVISTISGTSISFTTPAVFTSTTAARYISTAFDPDTGSVISGFSDQNNSFYAKSVVTSFSNNLTIGSNYFVQDDGTLATTSSSTKAGKAISTTALNLVDPT